jgi:hypothetical protein
MSRAEIALALIGALFVMAGWVAWKIRKWPSDPANKDFWP